MTDVRRVSPRRRFVAVLAAFVLAVAGVFVHGAPARSEENNAIKFGPVTLTHVTETGDPVPAPGRQLLRGNFFFLDISFDATTANPQPGDTFSISIPEPFVNRDAGNSQREVIKPLMVGATQVGDCNIKASLITCTLNDAVRGRTDILGTLRAQLVAGGVTSRTSSTFVINGQNHVLQHPWGEDIVAPGIVPFTPGTRAVKGATGVGSGSKAINWRVIFGGAWLKNNYPNGGPVTITDTISAGMDVPDPSTVQLIEVYGDPATGRATDRVVAKGNGTGELDGFKVTPGIEGRTVTFKVEGPLSTDKDYRVEFTTPFTGGETVIPGFQYTNAATFVEAGHTTPTAVRSYFESFKAIVTYKQGFGGFEVSKNIQGDVIPPRGQKFDVTVNYTLPAGTTAADYPGWDAPENPTKLTVTVGSTAPYMPTFPKGTTVTLSEDAASADPATPGIAWGAPVFSSTNNKVGISGDRTRATFTVEDQVTLPVSLMNTTETASGTFAISKTIVDGGSTGADTFSVRYACSAAGEGGVAAEGAVDVTAGADKVVGRFPVGTSCEVVSEDEAAAARAGYTLTVDTGQAVTVVKDDTVTVNVTNTYARDLGTFAIGKRVFDGGSTGTDTFSLNYRCSAAGADGVPATGTVQVNAEENKVVGRFPVGTTCEVVSEDEAAAARAGYTLTVDKGQPVTITRNDLVTVTNTYTRDLGTFAIGKTIVPGGSEGTDTFGIEYRCSAAGENDDGAVAATGTVAVTAGVNEVVGRFPVGTTCEVTSEVPAPRAGYTLTVDTGQAVTVVKDDTVTVNVTNTYARDLGTFAISKTIVDGGSTGADTFSVRYACSAAGEGGVAAEGAVDVTAGADKVVGRFPVGTSCEVVSEDEAAAARAGYTLTV
ncbi:DUF5979 domain-containing protein, partial [[Pseudopropionibacterium] massiliense]|uniref:DUF5979 domain-containing protein n=1 Tax=[Pseudopropionibacterium] massiliense TaxID=2220000 RepID=UPI0013EEEADE